MEENEELKEAVVKLDSLSADERMQRIAELREKAIMDEKAIYAKGLDDGEKRGEEKGQEKEKRRIVRNMLKKNMKIEDICQITGLTKKEIEQIKQF